MSNYYLLFLAPEIIDAYISSGQTRITLHHPAIHLQVDDKIVPVRTYANSALLPFLYKIISINRNAGTVTMQLEEQYNREISSREAAKLRVIRDALTKPRDGALQITTDVFNRIINAMRTRKARLSAEEVQSLWEEILMPNNSYMEEKALLGFIKYYITARGYYFDYETLANYHICLKTRPFVILAGLSGTGKSKLSQLYAEALGHKQRYLRLPDL